MARQRSATSSNDAISAAIEPDILHGSARGVLQDLEILTAEHSKRYKAAVEAGAQMGWGYYFAHLLAQNRVGRSAIMIGEDDGSICVFRWRLRKSKPRLDVYLPPIPMNVAVLRRCLERANEFNGDVSARIMRVDAHDVDAVLELPQLSARERRRQYIFAPANYEELSGKKRYTIRRNVAFVSQLPDVEIKAFSVELADGCLRLLERWTSSHRASYGTAGGAGVSRRAIELASRLPESDICGEVVLIDGEVSAFAFGGEIRPGLGCSFERKCDTDVRGLSYYHFRSLLLKLRDYEQVNDGSDTGRAGLTQLKNSFRPIDMHVEYRASQRTP